jgi:predicted Ser/Thr protein kinase
MGSYAQLANEVMLSKKKGIIVVEKKPQILTKIGEGNSACVFRIGHGKKAIKIFLPMFKKIAATEAYIYRRLGQSSYYPNLYDYGENYLVIDYIEGKTLYQCLLEGHYIERHVILKVDKALSYARERGLNPSDIHLRNIILTPDQTVKLIDVARFLQTTRCRQWDDLKFAYETFYTRRFFPKKWPRQLLESIALTYRLFKKINPCEK